MAIDVATRIRPLSKHTPIRDLRRIGKRDAGFPHHGAALLSLPLIINVALDRLGGRAGSDVRIHTHPPNETRTGREIFAAGSLCGHWPPRPTAAEWQPGGYRGLRSHRISPGVAFGAGW